MPLTEINNAVDSRPMFLTPLADDASAAVQ